MSTWGKYVSAVITAVLMLTGCGAEQRVGQLAQHEAESCIVQVNDFAAAGAQRDAGGRVRALAADGSVAFLAKATWTLTNGALVMRKPVNEVVLEFFRPDGSAGTNVEFSAFRLVMDMGGHGHTTDECPSTSPVVTKVNANTIRIKHINFVMGTRSPDKWFFYNFAATVNGADGVIARFNIPHKVN